MPAFLLKRITSLLSYSNIEIFVLEWMYYSPTYTVQRNKIKELVGDNFYSFGKTPVKQELELQKTIVDFCYEKDIDIIHIEEVPEGFDSFNPFDFQIQQDLYDKKHPWKIVETCHNIWFNPDKDKKIEPDGYACVTPHHINSTFKNNKAVKEFIPYPIDPLIQSPLNKVQAKNKGGWLPKGEFHIVNIGLWTKGKNQGYAVDIAKKMWEKYRWTYIFHFLGNQAPNFEDYWKPILNNLPPNVFVYGERTDTDVFYRMADAMLFTSTWECNPVVLKEAISNNLRILAFNLEHYGGEYNKFIDPLSGNPEKDYKQLVNSIHSPVKYKIEDYSSNVMAFAKKHIDFYNYLLNESTQRN